MKKPLAMDPKSKAKKTRARPDAKPEGDAAPRRADRPAFKRGGAVKGKGSTVNIVIAPQGGAAGGPQAVPVPVPVGGPSVGPGPGPMPGPGMPPKGLGSPPPGPMGPPPGAGPGFARGGSVMAGAGTGMSRLQRSR